MGTAAAYMGASSNVRLSLDNADVSGLIGKVQESIEQDVGALVDSKDDPLLRAVKVVGVYLVENEYKEPLHLIEVVKDKAGAIRADKPWQTDEECWLQAQAALAKEIRALWVDWYGGYNKKLHEEAVKSLSASL